MPCIQKILCGDRTIIGIRNFIECSKPESSLFINDYPGVSLKIAADVAKDETVSGKNLLKECINNAIKYVHSDLMDYVNTKFKFVNIVETRQTNENFTDDTSAAANLERGIILKRWRSELAKIHIQEIYVKPTTDCVVDILVYDGPHLTKYEDVTLKGGEINTVVLDFVAWGEQVKVLFNQKDTAVFNCNSQGHRISCNVCSSRTNNSEFIIRGWNGSKEDANCWGIQVLAFVRCFDEDIFCALLKNLYFPIYYRSVIELMNFRIHTTRVNNMATFGEDKAREIKEEVEELYKEKMKRVIDNSSAFFQSIKGDCLICNSMQYVQSTP